MTTKKYANFNCSTRSNFVTMQISQKEKKKLTTNKVNLGQLLKKQARQGLAISMYT